MTHPPPRCGRCLHQTSRRRARRWLARDAPPPRGRRRTGRAAPRRIARRRGRSNFDRGSRWRAPPPPPRHAAPASTTPPAPPGYVTPTAWRGLGAAEAPSRWDTPFFATDAASTARRHCPSFGLRRPPDRVVTRHLPCVGGGGPTPATRPTLPAPPYPYRTPPAGGTTAGATPGGGDPPAQLKCLAAGCRRAYCTGWTAGKRGDGGRRCATGRRGNAPPPPYPLHTVPTAAVRPFPWSAVAAWQTCPGRGEAG